MRNHQIRILWLVFFLGLLSGCFEFNGVSIVTDYENTYYQAESTDDQSIIYHTSAPLGRFTYYNASAALDRFVYDNADSVAINVNIYQNDLYSTDIYKDTDKTPADEALGEIIRQTHQRGLKVFLKVNVKCKRDCKPNEVAPSDPDAWFDDYLALIVEYARLAENSNVEMFSVGNGLQSLTTVANLPKWQNIITAIRNVFTGQITYCADWREYKDIPFWEQLDYIGINAYFPLDKNNDATKDDIINDWKNSRATDYSGRNWFEEINAVRQLHNKNVIFTEIGYPSADGGADEPWNNKTKLTKTVNLTLQENCYNGTIEFWSQGDDKNWFKGMFFHCWGTNMMIGGENDVTLTPLNKPAELALREQYGNNSDTETVPMPIYPNGHTIVAEQPTLRWAFNPLPRYETFDWENKTTQGWYAGTRKFGLGEGFSALSTPVNTDKKAYQGSRALKCSLLLIEGNPYYDKGSMIVHLAQSLDFSEKELSVALWFSGDFVNSGDKNGFQFVFEDAFGHVALTTRQDIIKGEQWVVYRAVLPADISVIYIRDITRPDWNIHYIRKVGFIISSALPDMEYRAGDVFVDDFDFHSEPVIKYQIQIDDSDTFTTPITDTDNLTSVFYNSSQLPGAQGEYHWRVRVDKGAGWHDWSESAKWEYRIVERGDVNNDGLVDLKDAIITLQICSGGQPTANVVKEADINYDGKLSMAETIYILQHISGLK